MIQEGQSHPVGLPGGEVEGLSGESRQVHQTKLRREYEGEGSQLRESQELLYLFGMTHTLIQRVAAQNLLKANRWS